MKRVQSWFVALGLTLVLSACNGFTSVMPRTDEPMLYLVLSTDSVTEPGEAVTALLATTGTPVHAAYRHADQFHMVRQSDQALFAWRSREVTGEPEIGYCAAPQCPSRTANANYVLDETSSGAGLGRRDLTDGETYQLDIRTGGKTIQGSATIPGRPRPTAVIRDGALLLVWRPVLNAAGYTVDFDIGAPNRVVSSDTVFVVQAPYDVSQPQTSYRMTVSAVDANWVAFMRDEGVTRAGIQGAFGLFAARNSTRIEIPASMPALH